MVDAHVVVPDEPSQQVAELRRPLLGELGPDQLGQVAGDHDVSRCDSSALCQLETPGGGDGRCRQVEAQHLVGGGEVLRLDVAPIGGPDAMAGGAAQRHAVVEVEATDLVGASHHDGLGGGEVHRRIGGVGVGRVVGVHLERLASLGAGQQIIEPDETPIGVDQGVTGEARVGPVDAPVGGRGRPIVDDAIELDARIRTGPRCGCDGVPQGTCLVGGEHCTVLATDELDVTVCDQLLQEPGGDAHRVVGVLEVGSVISSTRSVPA